jgi:hypothetical protein
MSKHNSDDFGSNQPELQSFSKYEISPHVQNERIWKKLFDQY